MLHKRQPQSVITVSLIPTNLVGCTPFLLVKALLPMIGKQGDNRGRCFQLYIKILNNYIIL